MEMAPLKVVCLVDSAGDEDEIGEGIWHVLSWYAAYRMLWRTEHVKMAGWQYSAPARERARLVDQPNIEWMDEIRTAHSTYPTLPNV